MATIAPATTTLGKDFSDPQATARPWAEAEAVLQAAEVYWISTVRPEGRPHVTPLIAVLHQGALYFCTGPAERKAKNLAENPNCILTTGTNTMSEGLDVVLEGTAVRVLDNALLQTLAGLYKSKYDWDFEVRGNLFFNDGGGEAYVFEVIPETAFGFGKGDPFSQTRWQFEGAPK